MVVAKNHKRTAERAQKKRSEAVRHEPNLLSPPDPLESKQAEPKKEVRAPQWDLKKISEADRKWVLFDKGKGAKCKVCMAAVGNSTGLSTLDRSYCTNNDMAAAIRKHKEAKYHKAAVEAKVAHGPGNSSLTTPFFCQVRASPCHHDHGGV